MVIEVALINKISDLIWPSLLLQVLEIFSSDTQDLVTLFTNELDIDCIRLVLESCRQSVCVSHIFLSKGFAAVFTLEHSSRLLYNLLLALRTANEVTLPLLIIRDPIDVASEFEVVCLLRLATVEGLFEELVVHLGDEAVVVTVGAVASARVGDAVEAGITVLLVEFLKVDCARVGDVYVDS